MNKQDLVEALTRTLGTRTDAKKAVDDLFAVMRKAIASGDKVVVSGFGSFHPAVMESKKGRNPRTGETIQLPPRKKVRFKQAKDFFE